MLPVDKEHVGGIINPATGAEGIAGGAGITTFPDAGEIQPEEFVTVKVYVPPGRAVIVVLVPDPVVDTLPGERISVHVPADGNPLNSTLPVNKAQDGRVMAPTTGAPGETDWSTITTFADGPDIQLFELETVKVYVPEGSPEIVVPVPVPVFVTPPGEPVNIHVSFAGKPFNTTLPDGTEHTGCVIAPTTGGDGLAFTLNE
jgi:hypothetical protein